MNSSEAKRILQSYRPETVDQQDAAFAEALGQVGHDPALKAWFDEHCRFQQALKAKLQSIPVPTDLKARLLAEPPQIVRPIVPEWGWKVLAAAAAVIFMAAIGFIVSKPRAHDRLSDCRARLVQEVLRAYSTDIQTSDPRRVQQYMLSHKATLPRRGFYSSTRHSLRRNG